MNDTLLTLKGALVGLAISAPIGPIGILILRRAILRGFGAGMFVGLAAAVADGLLAGVIAFGVTRVSDFFDVWVHELKLFGGVLLLVVGWRVWLSSPPRDAQPLPVRDGALTMFLAVTALTFTNPMTILGITVIYAGLGVMSSIDSGFHATLLVCGVIAGSLGWWVVLCRIGRSLRENASGVWIRRINQGCGILLAAIGAVQLSLLGLRLIRG